MPCPSPPHLTPEQIDAFGAELDELRASAPSPTSASATASTSSRSCGPSGASSSPAGRCCSPASSRRRGSAAPPRWRCRRSSTTWRSATTSCTGSTTSCRTRPSTAPRSTGTRSCPGDSVAPLAQLPPPHLHQHPWRGPRHRLRHPPHDARASPGRRRTSATRCTPCSSPSFFQYGVMAHDLEFEKHRRRRGRLGRQGRGLRPQIGPQAGSQTLKDYVLWPLLSGPVGAAHLRRQRGRQPGPQPLVVHHHLLRPLPRRRRTPSPRGGRPTRAGAAGTSASSSGSANIDRAARCSTC